MELEDLPKLKQDMLLDIGNGICGLQTTLDDDELINKKRKIKDYKPNTEIPRIINSILSPVLKQIHKERQWDNENEFISQGENIKLVYWSNDDWCKIQRDSNKVIKVNKKYFRELYENRSDLIK